MDATDLGARRITPSSILENAALRRLVRQVLASHGATDVLVFGSVARGEDDPDSDLDVMASFPPGFDLFDLMEVEEELESLLGIAVDVVATDDRSPHALADARAAAVPL